MTLVTTRYLYLLTAFTTVAVLAFTLASLFGRHPYLELASRLQSLFRMRWRPLDAQIDDEGAVV